MLTLSDPVVQVTAIKPAEEGDELILRLFEPTGAPRSTRVSLPWAGMDIPVELGRFEVVTLKVNWQEKRWKKVNLMEEA